jgi:molecular chaperone GrpE (heat shock protein)
MSDQEEVVQQEQPAEVSNPNEGVEKEARLFGWVPKEEFRGSEDDWVDAEAFVKRGKEINPILRKNNELLMKKLDDKAKEIDDIKASVEEFKKFQKEAFERKQVEYEAEIKELKSQKKAAIAEGNGDLVVDIDDRIDEIKEAQKEAKAESKEPPPAQTSSVTPTDPELASWLERNTWFGQDTEMTDVSNGLGASVRKQFPHLSGRAFLDKLDERIAQYFPDKTPLGRKQKGSAVDSSGSVRAGGTGKKTYDSLPAEAKAACDKFVKQGLFKSKQEYVDLYDWE